VHSWAEGQGAKEGDVIGLLLDLDRGCLSVWKNKHALGFLIASGLDHHVRYSATFSHLRFWRTFWYVFRAFDDGVWTHFRLEMPGCA
jgi:hypothetical protein